MIRVSSADRIHKCGRLALVSNFLMAASANRPDRSDSTGVLLVFLYCSVKSQMYFQSYRYQCHDIIRGNSYSVWQVGFLSHNMVHPIKCSTGKFGNHSMTSNVIKVSLVSGFYILQERDRTSNPCDPVVSMEAGDGKLIWLTDSLVMLG